MSETSERIRLYKKRLAWLEDDASTWITHARDIQEYALPNHGRFLYDTAEEPNDGSKKHTSIYNGTAEKAHEVLCAFIASNLTNRTIPWFAFSIDRPEYLEIEGVREWLEDCARRQTDLMGETNFYGSIHSAWEEVSGFGTTVVLTENIPGEALPLRYTTLTYGEYYIALNRVHKPDTLYRRLYMTATQLEKRFGKSALSDATKNLIDRDNPDERVKIIHVIQPREVFSSTWGPKSWKWESVYFEESQSDKLLSEGGYRACPFAVARWRVNPGDTYGTSPMMTALGDIKELQYLEKVKNQALSLQVQPPMNLPYSMKRQGGASLQPNGQNYYDGVNPDAVRPTLQVNVDIRAIREEIAVVEDRIKRLLYNDLSLQITERTERMTATEVRARQLEKMTVLGPVVGQLIELLTPIIERTFDILMSNGLLPPPPLALSGLDYHVKYIGQLSQAQKASQTAGVDSALAFIAQMAQVQSAQGSVDLLDNVDWDEGVDEVAASVGAPSRMFRTDDEVAQIRAQRAAQQQQQQMMQMAQVAPDVAKAAKDASNASVEGGKTTALDMFLARNQLNP